MAKKNQGFRIKLLCSVILLAVCACFFAAVSGAFVKLHDEAGLLASSDEREAVANGLNERYGLADLMLFLINPR